MTWQNGTCLCHRLATLRCLPSPHGLHDLHHTCEPEQLRWPLLAVETITYVNCLCLQPIWLRTPYILKRTVFNLDNSLTISIVLYLSIYIYVQLSRYLSFYIYLCGYVYICFHTKASQMAPIHSHWEEFGLGRKPRLWTAAQRLNILTIRRFNASTH